MTKMLNKKYKIVHLTTVHNPYDTRILRRECKSLAKEGYDVYLLNAKGINADFDGVKICSFDNVTNRFYRMTITMMKSFYAALSHKADLYHIHDPELIFVGLFLRSLNKKVIFDCHENFLGKIKARPWLNKALKHIFVALYKVVLKSLIQRFSAIIIAENSIRETITADNTPIALVRNYPDLDFISSIEVSEIKKEKTIFYSGGLTPNRGVEQVIYAVLASKVPDIRLVIVGKANPVVFKKLGHLLNDERIIYKGEVDFEEVVHLMKTSTLGVVCNQNKHNYQNALPNKLFEYMAAGLPVVFSDFHLWCELNNKFNFGMPCNSSEISSITNTLDHLLLDKNLQQKLAINGVIAADKMSWKKEFSTLSKLYKEVLNFDKL
jgi:glycosyltransferase involved in cell wall biosynthesis